MTEEKNKKLIVKFDRQQVISALSEGDDILEVSNIFNLQDIYNLIEKDVDTFEIAQLAGLHITDGLIKFYSDSIKIQDDFIEIAN